MINEKFLEPGFIYWFSNHEEIRTPFPSEIRDEIKKLTTAAFFDWFLSISDNEKNEIQENELIEMFEMILFNEASKLVEDEDIKLGILYPFMPKIGDKINHKDKGEGIIQERKIILNKENKNMFELSIYFQNTGQIWKTEFEITE
jgi:hypothetical protein